MPFLRGPDELKDLPELFRPRRAAAATCREHDIRIFAEIVEASALPVDAILEPAATRAQGADVIDLGCLPDTPFPHLEEPSRRCTRRAARSASTPPIQRNCGAARGPAPTICSA